MTGEASGTGRVQVGVNGDTAVRASITGANLTTLLSATDDAGLMPAAIRFGTTATIYATDPDATTINLLQTTTRPVSARSSHRRRRRRRGLWQL